MKNVKHSHWAGLAETLKSRPIMPKTFCPTLTGDGRAGGQHDEGSIFKGFGRAGGRADD